MSQHTPGPWGAYQLKGHEGSDFWWISAGNRNGWKGASYMQVSGQIGEANARLIAAAPELLEALEQAADYLAEFFEEGREHRVIKLADAAIAKAEGRA